MPNSTIPIAQAHPVETWAALGALLTALTLVVGVLYQRINTDIKGVEQSVKDLEDDVFTEINQIKRDLNEIGGRLSVIGQQIAQFATSATFSNEELDRLEADIKDLNRRLLTIEIEHLHCMKLHSNGLINHGAH